MINKWQVTRMMNLMSFQVISWNRAWLNEQPTNQPTGRQRLLLRCYATPKHARFCTIYADEWIDRPTDGQMVQQTDKASKRVACPQLKTNNDILNYVMDDWMSSFFYNSFSLTVFWKYFLVLAKVVAHSQSPVNFFTSVAQCLMAFSSNQSILRPFSVYASSSMQ